MATTKSRGTKAPAKAQLPKSRRVFPIGQCHHRDAKGTPDCTLQIVAKRANLCPAHESVWQKAARARYAANRAAVASTAPKATAKPKAAKSTPTPAADTAPAPEAASELEEQLAASVSAFATPELAQLARQRRQARKNG